MWTEAYETQMQRVGLEKVVQRKKVGVTVWHFGLLATMMTVVTFFLYLCVLTSQAFLHGS